MQMRITFKKMLAFSVALWPILDTYVLFAGINIGEMLVLASSFCCMLTYGKLRIDRIKYLYLYMLLISLVGGVVHRSHLADDYGQNVLSYVLYAIFLICVTCFTDKDTFFDVYTKVSTVVCCLSLLQFILMSVGIKFVEIIPGIPNAVDMSYSELQNYLVRMCGPFQEPAHLVQYLSVAVVILFYGAQRNIKVLLLHIVTICLTLSGNGLVILAAIFGIKILSNLKEKNVKIFIRTVGVIIGLSIALVIMYLYVPDFRRLLMRASEITGNSKVEALGYVSASGYFRVKYGFDIFMNTPVSGQLFGLGAGIFNTIYKSYDVVPDLLQGVYNSSLLLFRSGFTTVLIDFGLVGMLIYLIYLFRKRSRQSKQVALILLIIQLIASVINTSIWVIFILLVITFDDNKGNVNSVKHKINNMNLEQQGL